MNKSGPIVLIDDDDDDLQLLIEIFADMNLPNEIHLFKNTSSVIAFLEKPEVYPFLIISDINMPVMNGFELRDAMSKNEVISKKRIPFVYFSTATSFKSKAHERLPAFQGIFTKPSKHADWKTTLQTIIHYWTLSMPQENFEQ